MEYLRHYDSPLGGITLAGDGECLTGLWFDGQKHFAAPPGARPPDGHMPGLDEAECWLDLYFSGKQPDFTPPLRLEATAFRKAVCEILLTVPYGQTVTYGKIASRIAAREGAARTSARAVGGAVGRNPISLIVPCHRVVGADGRLTGYAGGIERKIWLLRWEHADLRGLFVSE